MWASRCASRLAVAALALTLAAPSAWGREEAEEATPSTPATSYSHRMAQGRFFLEANQSRQALAEFEAAALLPEGQARSEVHQLLAQTRYALGEIAGAVEAAKTAAALEARLPPEFAEFHDFLTGRFGKVLIVGGSVPNAARPEPATPILDPELKRAFEGALARIDQLEDGSTSIYLPVGSYRVGGHIVEVIAKGITRMDLRPSVGDTGRGVYGERRKDDRKTKKRRGKKKATEPHGALLLQTGAAGYAQQGAAGGSARGLVGAELGVGRLVLDAAGLLGVTRAERLVGVSATPSPQLGARLGIAGAFGGRVRVGPSLAALIGGVFVPAAPAGYLGPDAYGLLGVELGLRLELPGDRASLVVTPHGFAAESAPIAALRPEDAAPHLTVGGGVDVGVRIR